MTVPSVGERLPAMHEAVPAPVRAWLAPARPDEPCTPDALVREARVALVRASRPERPHGGAFDLLAADAWVTWACQVALELDDVDAVLDRVLATIVE